jgi:soluble lytic murein transglycosylase-like protein
VDRLRAIGVAAMVGLACPAAAETVADWHPLVAEASRRFGLPVAWIERVMQAESAGRTRRGGRPITSRAGAMGLMQLMPQTWAAMRRRLDLGRDPYDPRDNILAGSLYLRMMFDRFGHPGLFAAYNAGPGRYAAFVAGRTPLPEETRRYLADVTAGAVLAHDTRRKSAGLFAIANRAPDRMRREPMPDSAVGLFAIRR